MDIMMCLWANCEFDSTIDIRVRALLHGPLHQQHILLSICIAWLIIITIIIPAMAHDLSMTESLC